MTTCEQCGADAVDDRGICANCGWDAEARMYRDDDDAHSLGETRAAQVESSVAQRRESQARAAMDPQFERTAQMAPYSPSGAGSRPGTGAPSSTSRFCGTCGARIVGNEAFCGQCGTPVGLGSGDYGSGMDRRGSGPGQYGPREDTWATADREAATESFGIAPMPGYARSGLDSPYGQTGYGAGSMAGQPADDSSRTVKTVFGVLCLVGSIVSAVAAVILAVHK